MMLASEAPPSSGPELRIGTGGPSAGHGAEEHPGLPPARAR